MSGTLTILQAGPAMTVQDHGRPGYRALGLTHGGAADPTALHEGAALLGQDPNCAAIEMAGSGGSGRSGNHVVQFFNTLPRLGTMPHA